MPLIPGERIVELLLEIVLEAMRGQTPEQRRVMWDWYIEDVKWWREVLKIGKANA
jgi:hypothetical protein